MTLRTDGLSVDTITAVLGDRARVVDALEAAWEASSPADDILQICAHRIASLLKAELQWPPAPVVTTAAQKACLALAEQWVIDVASMPDELVADVARHLGDDGLRDFVHALLVFEQRIRLDVAWHRLGLVDQ